MSKRELSLNLTGAGVALEARLASKRSRKGRALLVTYPDPLTGEMFTDTAIYLKLKGMVLSRLEVMGEGDKRRGVLLVGIPHGALKVLLKDLKELFKNDPP